MTTALDQLQATIGRVAEQVGPAVVGIGSGWHLGSGVVIEEGKVLTNAHNLRGEEIAVTLGDGPAIPAQIEGVDTDLDIAVLSLETGDLRPVEWTPAEGVTPIGAPVVALANPGGRGLRATLGFVSARDRSFRGPGGRRITGCIEHTAPVPRGSSGGPIVDPAGSLLGLNTIRLTGGLILAIAADAPLNQRLERLAEGEPVGRPRLGVAVAPAYVARRLRGAVGLPERDGVLVRAVEETSPAAAAGIEKGDLIVAAAGQVVDGAETLYEVLDRIDSREALDVEIVRGAEELELKVSFEQPREEARR